MKANVSNVFLRCCRLYLLADDVVYDYIYSVKGDRLIIDFTKDIVRDCEYTFTTDNGILTLVGGSGTDGGSYKLNRK